MKIKKLDTRGFSHELLLVLVLVIGVITGVGFMVASHADTGCPTSGATSSTTSSSVSGCPTSGVVSGKVYAAACTIGNLPATVARGTTINPTITITNKGTGQMSPHMITFIAISGGPTTYLKEKLVSAVKPGESKTVQLASYTIPANSRAGSAQLGTHSDLNYKSSRTYFDCQQAFQIL